MRKLVIAAAVSMSLATISVNTHALSLGEIEMYSALNQSLDAEINIVSFAPGELTGVSVGLASGEAFAEAGMQRSQVLSALRFDVERRPDGVPVVKVSSNGPIVEPFLSFLLQVDSPQGGRFVREYTVLLDPPVFAAQQNELVEPVPAVIQSAASPSGVGVSSVIQRGSVIEDGLELDLASELGSETSEVTFQQLTVESDTTAIDLIPMASTNEAITDSDASGDTMELAQTLPGQARVANIITSDGQGVLLDLDAELLGETPEFTDSSAGLDIELDELAETDNSIFTDEASRNLPAIDENLVSLNSLAVDSTSDTLGVDSATAVGQLIDLDTVIPDNQIESNISGVAVLAAVDGSESIDLNSSIFEPEVTLEEVSAETVPASTIFRGSSGSFASTSADEELGEAIDISGIVAGEDSDFSDNSAITTFTADTYRVQANDTLWSIARSRKSSGVSTPRMVAAILAANQEAFIDGDSSRLRSGAELRIPAELASSGNFAAVPIVRQQASPEAEVEQALEPAQVQETLTIVGVDESASGDGLATTGDLSGASDLDRNLAAVNRKMMLAQEELTSESLQRDELSSRVLELEDSLANMKKLITLRESELGNLQSELQNPTTDADNAEQQAQDLEVSEAEKNAMQQDLQRLQDNISADASTAQERIDAQADADRNLAAAEAEAKSVRLETEEDTLRAQLAQLQLEKAELIETAQNDKLALVQQAEAEKAELLAEAKAERELIRAQLEAENVRISDAAEAESVGVAEEARVEQEKLLAEASVERDRLAAESEAMRTRLEVLEEEKDRLLAESQADKAQLEQTTLDQARLQAEAEAEKLRFEEESTKVQDRLAALQAEASANLTDTGEQGSEVVGGVVDKAAEVGADATDTLKDLTGAGAVAAGGLVAAAPLQNEVGSRKKVLAIGGGLALVGLLGAWAMRRRRVPAGAVDRDAESNEDIGSTARLKFDNRDHLYEEAEEPRSTMGTAAVAASAAAAATGAAVMSRDSSANEAVRHQDRTQAPADDIPVVADVVQDRLDHARQASDGAQLDDTITEADVYVRYGLHGQAEDLLQAAIERAPDNEEYHLKLLENYQDQKNTDGFKAAATNYKGRFANSSQWPRVAEMGRTIDPNESLYAGTSGSNISGGVVAAGAGAAATAAAAAVSSVKAEVPAKFDETIDAGAEFNVDDLAATGDFSRADDTFGFEDLDDISLDEVDLAALDDDGTLNLEEVAGNQMSGLDLGSLDLTNPDGDSTLDNLTLDDADLNSLGDVTAGVRSGLESDLDLSDSFDSDSNEMETMLDLAKAYIDMGDPGSASNALKDIVANGNAAQKKEATDLLKNLT